MQSKWTVIVAALALAACARQKPEAPVAAAVELAPVREVAAGNGTRYSATVEPDAQVAVAFRVSGYVDAVAAEEGDRVEKGALLARIRRADYAEKLGQATASHAEAQAALGQARKDLERSQALFAANALTKRELDAAVASVEMSEARLNRGRAAAGEAGLALSDTALVAPISGVILRRNIEQGDLGAPGATAFVLADTRAVKVTFGAPDTMISALETGNAIEVTTESLPDRTFRGTIARVAPAADPKTRNFDVEIRIDNASNALKPGMVASIEVGPYGGRPARTPPGVSPGGTYVGTPGTTPGTTAGQDARPVAAGTAAVLAIPLDAVIRDPKSRGYAVYVVEDGKARSRPVDLGEPMGNLVALRGGLRGGEQVVVSGPALLVDGQPVRVVNGGTHAR